MRSRRCASRMGLKIRTSRSDAGELTVISWAEIERLRERFFDKVMPVTESGCWLWMASCTPQGYGEFWDGYRVQRAHRWAYFHFVEAQPAELVLDHLCRVRNCVNPAHLEPVLQRTNVLRGECPAAKQARQTHCIHGHELVGDNVYRKPNGARQCVACRRETDRRRPCRP